jgi:putative transposase
MSRYRRADTPGASYFFTLVSYRRQPILCDEPIRSALRRAVAEVRARRAFVVEAWVLLPDHLHCIWTLPPGDADFATRWALIKRGVSLACGARYRKVAWLSVSKQKHRRAPRDWPYSTLHRYIDSGRIPADRGGKGMGRKGRKVKGGREERGRYPLFGESRIKGELPLLAPLALLAIPSEKVNYSEVP